MAFKPFGVAEGDSFGNGYDEWPYLISYPVRNNCVLGRNIIADMAPVWTATLANRPTGSQFAIIQGGVNDIRDDATAAQLASTVTSMVEEAAALDLKVVVVGQSPWKNWVASLPWTVDRQAETDAYEEWLIANASSVGFVHAPIYAALEGAADELDAAYDKGDGLHPNADGEAIIAASIDAALDSLGLSTAVNMNIKSWRGAVEPAETGSSGNEIKLWKGAVEPAASGGGIVITNPTLDGAKIETLMNLTGLTGPVNALEWAWLYGLTGDATLTLEGQWLKYLGDMGYTGSVSEMQMQSWKALGYTGTYNELALQFWQGGGVY